MVATLKTRPIIFSGAMIRAILDRRKTQTRRVVKPQPQESSSTNCITGVRTGMGWSWLRPTHAVVECPSPAMLSGCPYGALGDRLWVKETWGLHDTDPKDGPDGATLYYQATDGQDHDLRCQRWRSPRFMFRWASRITLEVKSIRVERLQEISEEDAIAEGFDLQTCESVLLQAAGKTEPLDACWLTHQDGEEYADGDDWCTKCANELAAEHDLQIDGNWGSAHESDGPATCDQCGSPLMMSLSECAIDRDLFLESPSEADRQRYPAKGADAAIFAMIAGGIGDLKEKHKGRLAQIGFASLWDSINAKRGYPWSAEDLPDGWPADLPVYGNPWVWVIEFTIAENNNRLALPGLVT